MANAKRIRALAVGGLVEDNPLAAGGVTLNSAGLAAMPAIASTEHAAITFDPDGLFGDPEVSWITAHTAAATSATILRGQEGTTARQHDRDVPWVHGPTPAGDFDRAGLLAVVAYDPGSSTGLSTTSTTYVDVSAANLVLPFSAPPSGKVLVRLSAAAWVSASSMQWNLRDAGGDVTNTEMYVTSSLPAVSQSRAVLVTGLTPGTAYSYKWGWKMNSAATANMTVGGADGPATMEAWAVNA